MFKLIEIGMNWLKDRKRREREVLWTRARQNMFYMPRMLCLYSSDRADATVKDGGCLCTSLHANT